MTSRSTTKVELTENQIIFIAAVSLLLIIVYLGYVYIPRPESKIYTYNFHGIPLSFRADLREAAKVPVYPDEGFIYYELRGGLAENITIVFVPVEEENGIYSVNGFEIAYKLGLLFRLIGKNVTVDAKNVSSYEYLPGKIQNPIIALVHPKYANETSVKLDGHVIFISGLPSNDVNSPYSNLDLATLKFLMIVLNINV